LAAGSLLGRLGNLGLSPAMALSTAVRQSNTRPPQPEEPSLMSREEFAKRAGMVFLPGDKREMVLSEMPLSPGDVRGILKFFTRPAFGKEFSKIIGSDPKAPEFITLQGETIARSKQPEKIAFGITRDEKVLSFGGFSDLLKDAGIIKSDITPNWFFPANHPTSPGALRSSGNASFQFPGPISTAQAEKVTSLAEGLGSVRLSFVPKPNAKFFRQEQLATTLTNPSKEEIKKAIQGINAVYSLGSKRINLKPIRPLK
jgi:hypothetical protein